MAYYKSNGIEDRGQFELLENVTAEEIPQKVKEINKLLLVLGTGDFSVNHIKGIVEPLAKKMSVADITNSIEFIYSKSSKRELTPLEGGSVIAIMKKELESRKIAGATQSGHPKGVDDHSKATRR